MNASKLAAMLGGSPVRTHLIGVAGSGMSGIAGLLLALGHKVSGSDRVSTVEVDRLQKLGLHFFCPQEGPNVTGAQLVIYSSAIRPGNPEYDEAARTGIPMVRRADALAAIMEGKRGILVAGMHGKTTTSSMAAHVLRMGGVHPSHYIGAEIPILGTNAHWDPEGEWFVAEGDESDGTLVNYRPEHAIILNVEEEHLDFYQDLAAIDAVFERLLGQTRGHIFYCGDDPHATRLCAARDGAISFGEGAGVDYRFDALSTADFQSRFRVWQRGEVVGEMILNVPGRHNVSNALGVIALGLELGIPFERIAAGLGSFQGARRRFELKYRSPSYLVVDDYAHHPSEIRATLATARANHRQRLIVLFQPHRYTRTHALQREFGGAFHDADRVFLTEIYPASEPPMEGVTSQLIADAMVAQGHDGGSYQPDRVELVKEVGRLLRPGDCVITLGAGDVHEQGAVLARDLTVLETLVAIMGQGAARLYEPMAKHTTLRVGGPAQYWLEPEDEAAFARVVAWCHQSGMPLLVIGRGSNLLVRDGGIPGVVVHFPKGPFREISHDGLMITAGAGVRFKELAMDARANGIGGFEWMEGIPGNVGGGLRMNAGAMGAETFERVRSLRVVTQEGEIETLTPEALEVGYRNVPSLKRQYVVSATFEGFPREPQEISRLLDESMHKRRHSQPRESSAGCIFKNPTSCPAGKLVDELGLKESSVGSARVSSIHGNFIVNDGGASARDVLALIEQIKTRAREQRGIVLETEVQIIGQDETFLTK